MEAIVEAGAKNITLIDTVVDLNVARSVGLVLGFSLLLALSAQVRIPLYFTPVPITAQTFVVLLAGALLGPRLGAATMLTYLVEGATGLPVFQGGNSGLAYMLGPTGGYLLGFIASATIAGWFAGRGYDRHFLTAIPIMILAEVALYACGLARLSSFVPADQVLQMGLIPFIPGDVIKIAAAAATLPLGWKFLGKRF
jgi:biotin transport system substrate-specific component